MELEFCSWKDFEVHGKEKRTYLPTGRIYLEDDILKLSVHILPEVEYFLIEESDPKNSLKLYSIYCIHPLKREGKDDYIDLKVGIMKVTQREAIYINFNFLPASYKVMDPNHEFMQHMAS